MTELEQLYFQDERELTFKIADALKKEDQSFIDKVNQEFSYEYDFQLAVSTYAFTTGDFIVDTLEEAKLYYSDELKVDDSDVDWNTTDIIDEVEVDRMNARIYGLSLINPSPEAQALINSKQQ
jgi:hypothetical protein